MFESSAVVRTAHVAAFVEALSRLDTAVDDAERIDQIRLLEQLKAAAAAAQAKVTTAFAASQKAAQVDAGTAAKDVGKGVAAQVGLAKRESPARASRYVGWATILTTELPHTFAALQAGTITEWRAQLVARETGWLSLPDRTRVDQELGPRLESLGDRAVEVEAKKLAYRLDPRGYLGRISKAEGERRVTLRPAPDTMSILSGLLPVAQGVAVYSALTKQADSLRAGGDGRSRGQIMADTLVERVTGQTSAENVSVDVKLVMTDQTMFNHGPGASEPAHVQGFGPIPAELARRLVRTAAAGLEDGVGTATAWLKRLYTHPATGELVAMESRRRRFEGGLAEFLVVRDQVCRTPWCDAPVRHGDHVRPFGSGGETAADNGQGLCEACNLAKQATGWTSRTELGSGTWVETITPTGHVYRSRPPDPPGEIRRRASAVEQHLKRLVDTHIKPEHGSATAPRGTGG